MIGAIYRNACTSISFYTQNSQNRSDGVKTTIHVFIQYTQQWDTLLIENQQTKNDIVIIVLKKYQFTHFKKQKTANQTR